MYAWLWRTMDHILLERHRRLRRERPRPDDSLIFTAAPDSRPDPLHQLQDELHERNLLTLSADLARRLTVRQQAILALYLRGRRRPEVAHELGVTDRVVKRQLERILAAARDLVVRRSGGGGCPSGTGLVCGLAFGLGSDNENAQARMHIARCERCRACYDQLRTWREDA